MLGEEVERGMGGGSAGLWVQLREWVRDMIDVLFTLGIILVILRLLLGANMLVPLVVVTTGSMVHHGGDNTWMLWLNERGVGNETIGGMALTGGFNQGDMIVVARPDVSLGDVVIYERDNVYGRQGLEPIIHRVVGIVRVNGSGVDGIEGTTDCFVREDFLKYIKYVEDCRQGGQYCAYPAVPTADSYSFFITKGDANAYSDQCIPGTMKISIPVTEAQVPAKALFRLPYVGWLKIALNGLIRILTFQF